MNLGSLKAKLSFGAMVVALVLLAVQAVLQFQLMRGALQRQIEAEQMGSVNQLARALDDKLQERVLALKAAAFGLPGPLSQDLTTLENLLKRETALLTLYDDLYIFDAKGVLLVDWPVKPGRRKLDMSSRDYIKAALATRDATISKPILGKATQQPIVVVATPLFDSQGQVAGIMAGVLNLYQPNLLGSLPSRPNGETGHFYLVGADRSLIAHPDKARILKPVDDLGANPALDQALQGFEGSLLTNSASQGDRLETFKRLRYNNWVLAGVLPTAEAYAPIDTMRNWLFVITALLLAVCVPALRYFAQQMLRPLGDLTQAMQQSAQRIEPGIQAEPVPVTGSDEIRTASTAFNDFLQARNQAEARLSASEARMSLIVSHVSDGIWDWDMANQHVFINPPMRQMLGLTDTQAIHPEDLDTHIHPDDRARVLRERKACAMGFQEQFDVEHRLPAGAGQWKWVRVNGRVSARAVDGRALRMLGTVTDVSAQREQLATLARAKAEAEAASAAKSHFLANMSHEIRTPMNGVIGLTELCLQTELTPVQRDYLNMVDSSARSLLTVIDDILDFSKIEAHKLELDNQAFSLVDSFTNTCRNLSLRAAKKQLDLVLHMAPDVPDWVVGDAGRLQQVVTNLVGNAIKFTSTGHVLVKVQRASALTPDTQAVHLRIDVADTGIGIARDKLKLIFDAFTQADATTTRQFGGTGLGLSICRDLVLLMGGTLTAESTPNEGSRFSFTLTLQRDLTADSTTEPTRIRPGQTALVVLANAVQGQCLADGLTALGVSVRNGTTTAQALQMQGDTVPDMVFADADLAPDALLELATHWPGHTVACARVGNLLQESAQRDTDEPCVQAFVLVPLDTKELAACVEHLQSTATQPGQQPLHHITHHAPRHREDTTTTGSATEAAPTYTEVVPGEMAAATDTPAPSLVILVAEDNAVNQKLIQVILTRMGHRVTLANNGLEAVQAIKVHGYDLVLMDIQMPEMGGIDATAAIRQYEASEHPGRHTPIVALTANALKGDRETYLSAGMDGYVPKPIMLPHLKSEIERVTRRA
jgi:two-component system sensor histidine kinase/response regulator